MSAQILNSFHYLPRLQRQAHEHKGHAGKVLIMGGATGMVGAPLLAAKAALYSGAGWVVIGFLDENALPVIEGQPELMIRLAKPGLLHEVRPDVVVIGPGLGQSDLSKQLLQEALQVHHPLVIDADAIHLLAKHADLLSLLNARPFLSTVLTPHPGEAASLLKTSSEKVQDNREQALQDLIKLSNSIVVLKGHQTLIGGPDQITQVCMKGNPGMGVGGMGDVLTGVIAALISQGLKHQLNAYEATALAIELHSEAADMLVNQGVGPIGLTPMEVIVQIRNLINIK